jgi:hypothetical protein
MQELAQRVYFRICLNAGRLLRSGRYSKVRIVGAEGTSYVAKRRLPYAPLFVWLGGPLVRLLGTGVRVLRQRDWEARERMIHERLRGTTIRIANDGTLILPFLSGETLASMLENPQRAKAVRTKAIERAVVALSDFHHRGFSHGDAMAENVMIDPGAEVAHWFDFETVHDPGRPLAWRRADDVRALLVTCLVRTPSAMFAETIELVLDVYDDPQVSRLLAASFDPVLQRPLTFHLAQAGFSYSDYREVGRLLKERVGR